MDSVKWLAIGLVVVASGTFTTYVKFFEMNRDLKAVVEANQKTVDHSAKILELNTKVLKLTETIRQIQNQDVLKIEMPKVGDK